MYGPLKKENLFCFGQVFMVTCTKVGVGDYCKRKSEFSQLQAYCHITNAVLLVTV